MVAGEGEGFAGLGSDVHKVQRDIRDWREEEAGTRYLKRAEEMKKLSGCAELGQAQTRGRERSDQPGERGDEGATASAPPGTHLVCNPVLRSLFSLSPCPSYSATFYFKQQHAAALTGSACRNQELRSCY